MSDVHKHKCDECDTVWQHDGATLKVRTGAHDCPECGAFQVFRYHGTTPPDYIDHHLRDATNGRKAAGVGQAGEESA